MDTSTAFFKCLVCGTNRVRVGSHHWTCQHCGQRYQILQGIPVLVRDWKEHERSISQAITQKSGWYVNEQGVEDGGPWSHHLAKRRGYIERAISIYLRSKSKDQATNLLDLGCGDGNHLGFLGSFSQATYGTDYNHLRLVRARARATGATIFLSDVLDFPIRDEFFEIIFFNHVLEHIPDDLGALRTAYQVLQPGGLLILGIPNEGVLWWQLAYRLQPQMLESTDHIHFYTADTVAAMLNEVGFRILEIKHLGWGPPHWSLDARLRSFKILDDVFEVLGRTLIPTQASSLYILATI